MEISSARGLKAEILDFSSPHSGGGSGGGIRKSGLGRVTAGVGSDGRDPVPFAVGIMRDRTGRGAEIVLIGNDEGQRKHPAAERAFRLSKGEAKFVVTGIPELLSHWRPSHRRPLELGVSVGLETHPAGTLGAFVTMADGTLCMLSANHVLAKVNAAESGDPVIQPGRRDGAPPDQSAVGRLQRYVSIKPEPAPNLVDCAVADLAEGVTPTTAFAVNAGDQPFQLTGVGETDELFLGDPVLKFGRTTGRTTGRVFAVEVDNFRVNMGTSLVPRMCIFHNQMQVYSEYGPFAMPGDSGSLVVDPDGRAHGLLFAGTPQGGPAGTGLATANVLELALRELDAKLWLG